MSFKSCSLRFQGKTRGSFSPSHSDRKAYNPIRRWFYHKVFAGLGVGLSGYVGFRFYKAGNGPEDTSNFLPFWMLEPLYLLPLNAASRAWGNWASDSTNVPPVVHEWFIRAFIWFCGINTSELEPKYIEDLGKVDENGETTVTAQSFFTRRLKDGVRVVDKEAILVSPCDARLLQSGEVSMNSLSNSSGDNCIVQVKGCHYPINSLVRYTMKPIPKSEEDLKKRLYFIFHLRPKDYHHVHAPAEFRVKQSILVPGLLLPVTNAARKAFPSLYVGNERIVVHGELLDKKAMVAAQSSKSSKKGNSSGGSAAEPSAIGQMALVLVGATCVGNIRLHYDHRLNSNLPIAPEFAMVKHYTEGLKPPLFSRGDDVGYFKWGSSVVMVVDCPKDSKLVPQVGDEVKMGQPLLVAQE